MGNGIIYITEHDTSGTYTNKSSPVPNTFINIVVGKYLKNMANKYSTVYFWQYYSTVSNSSNTNLYITT